jgi:hypothetical protein
MKDLIASIKQILECHYNETIEEGIFDFFKKNSIGSRISGKDVVERLSKQTYHNEKTLRMMGKKKYKLITLSISEAKKFRDFTEKNIGQGGIIDVDKYDRLKQITFESLLKNPPILDEDGFIWDGNHRIQRAIDLKIEKIPVIQAFK